MNIDDLKKLEQAATLGPWTPVRSCTCGHLRAAHNYDASHPTEEWTDADLAIIATLRNLAPELIAVVEAAQAARQFPVPAYSEDRLDGALEVLAAKLAQQEKAQ